MKDFEDDYVKRLQQSMYRIKRDREVGERYMSIELYLQDEREKSKRIGRQEGRLEGRLAGRIDALLNVLQARRMISEQIKQRIKRETKEEKLDRWIQLAATAATQEEFEEKMDL